MEANKTKYKHIKEKENDLLKRISYINLKICLDKTIQETIKYNRKSKKP